MDNAIIDSSSNGNVRHSVSGGTFDAHLHHLNSSQLNRSISVLNSNFSHIPHAGVSQILGHHGLFGTNTVRHDDRFSNNRPASPGDAAHIICMDADAYAQSSACLKPSPGHLPDMHCCSSSQFSRMSNESTREGSPGHVVRTRRRKAGISEDERVCVVCGETASGYNFDRLTCESCKAFFRRNALKPKDKIKACSRGGGCAIEGSQRKHCPSCRLEKCLATGMKKELILPPEKLEQRAKPRRRKHQSPHDGAPLSPTIHTTSSSTGGSTAYTSHHQSPLQHLQPQQQATSILNSACQPPANISLVLPPPQPLGGLNRVDLATGYRPVGSSWISSTPAVQPLGVVESQNSIDDSSLHRHGMVGRPPSADVLVSNAQHTDKGSRNSSPPLYRCQHPRGSTLCRHRRCRRVYQRRQSGHGAAADGWENRPAILQAPDSRLLACLRECVQRIREPFTPAEQLETGAAVTLEQEYNRMDACIRRIIRVVKLLPYFNEMGKPVQLSLLRANIYGLIVLYSSFFFERDIRKLRYPVLQSDGHQTTVTVSMLDEVEAPHGNSQSSGDDKPLTVSPLVASFSSSCSANSYSHFQTIGLREDFELYKANTLATLDHLDELAGEDDTLRVALLAVKLFSEDALPEEMRRSVSLARQAYLYFLWAYLRWQAGPNRLRRAAERYARLLLAFIDLRTLELRMTEFAKLLSLEGLSPLMREVCSQRTALCVTRA